MPRSHRAAAIVSADRCGKADYGAAWYCQSNCTLSFWDREAALSVSLSSPAKFQDRRRSAKSRDDNTVKVPRNSAWLGLVQLL